MREKLASLFGRWGAFVARHPWAVIFVTLVLVATAASKLPNVRLDTTTEGFLLKDDPILADFHDFRAKFGRDDPIVIGIETDEIYDIAFLERLRDLHEELEQEVPYVDEITSLINARWTRGAQDELIVEDLLEEFPSSQEDLDVLAARVASNPLYENLLVSKALDFTAIQIDLETYVQDGVDADGAPVSRYLEGNEIRSVTDAVYRIVDPYRSDDFQIYVGGASMLPDRLGEYLVRDIRGLVMISTTIIASLLLVLFRRLTAVFLPMLIVILTVMSTMGILAWLGLRYQMPTQVLPVALLAIGVGDAVHILAIYFQRRDTGMEKAGAIEAALEHSGISVLMTSVTTAAALASFLSATLTPVYNIGILAPTGVMIAFALTMTLLPAVLVVLPERKRSKQTDTTGWIARIIVAAGDFATRRPRVVLAVSLIATLVALGGASRLRFSHDPMTWFPEGDQLREATLKLNEKLGGVVTLEAVYDTGAEGNAQEPEFLEALAAITEANAVFPPPGSGAGPFVDPTGTDIRVNKTVSVADMLKEINRALNENRQEHYKLPDSRELAAQELLLFELSGNDDLEDFADYSYQIARMTMRVPWGDAIAYEDFITALRNQHESMIGDEADLVFTGRLLLLSQTFDGVVRSMAFSYVLAFAAITPLMVLILGRLKLGLLAMIPNTLPIVGMLGMMGYIGIPLDGFTLLSGSIALGLAVDDTIHFMNGYSRNFARCGDVAEAVRETLETTGRALFSTTVILCSAFAVFVISYMQNNIGFGLNTAFALAAALVCDVFLAPALVALANRDDAPARL